MKKKLSLSILGTGALLLLSACGHGDVTSQSSGVWERLILTFGKAIQGLSFGGSIGLGIIIFTILIRAVMIPLYNRQIKSSRELQELQPELRRLQSEYPGRENREALAYAQQELYKEHGVNPYASFLPLIIQFPILMALYGALTRVPELREGSFLWVDLGQKDPYFILPILAAAFTFLSTWLTNKVAKDRSAMLIVMNIMLPIFIFWFGTQISSGVALYWTVSNAFQVVQILVFNNPFKIIAERNRLEAEEKEGGQMIMCKALEELRMEGVLQGRTEGIRATVKTCKKFQINKEAIIETIGKEFSMPEKEVAEYVEKYW